VAKSSRRTGAVRGRESKIVGTSGEIFADGSAIELVSATGNQLNLLLWHEDRQKIAPRIEYRGSVYEAPELDGSLRKAIRFPSDVKEFGTKKQLFAQMQILFERHIGLTSPESALLTAWVCSSWFPDCLPSPPTLMISGPETGPAITLFRLLSCVCRRSLMLADLNRTSLLSLMLLHPTLLVNQPSWSLKFSELCRASNHRGIYVVGSRGKVHSVVGSKALFVGMADAESDEAIHLSLPALHRLPRFDEKCEAEIAKQFQGQLLMHRLRDFDRVRKSCRDVLGLDSPTTELAQNLMTCVANEPDILQAIGPILHRQGEDLQAQRFCDLSIVLIEAVWASLHDAKEITVGELAERTNALLRVRGETLEYSAVEVGWRLRNMGVDRHRNGGGMVLQFSQANNVLIHRLAKQFGLKLPPRIGCANCGQQGTLAT
jgi:hypothetical protein